MPPPPLPDTDDHLRCMTVLPYLEDLYMNEQMEEEDEYNDEEIILDTSGQYYAKIMVYEAQL